jgi:hypothetical protein
VSNGVMDGHQTMDRPSNPDLLCSQMGYIFLENSNADVALQLFQKTSLFMYLQNNWHLKATLTFSIPKWGIYLWKIPMLMLPYNFSNKTSLYM